LASGFWRTNMFQPSIWNFHGDQILDSWFSSVHIFQLFILVMFKNVDNSKFIIFLWWYYFRIFFDDVAQNRIAPKRAHRARRRTGRVVNLVAIFHNVSISQLGNNFLKQQYFPDWRSRLLNFKIIEILEYYFRGHQNLQITILDILGVVRNELFLSFHGYPYYWLGILTNRYVATQGQVGPYVSRTYVVCVCDT